MIEPVDVVIAAALGGIALPAGFVALAVGLTTADKYRRFHVDDDVGPLRTARLSFHTTVRAVWYGVDWRYVIGLLPRMAIAGVVSTAAGVVFAAGLTAIFGGVA